jgi:hypothetical protein
MNLIDEIKARLSKYPDIRYESNVSSIKVSPLSDDGFEVLLTVNREGYSVFFSGWHEEFDDEDDALNCFAFGLSDECRLKEYRRGRFPYKWTVESRENGKWIGDSTTGLLLFPFWKKVEVRYLQNNLIKSTVDLPNRV